MKGSQDHRHCTGRELALHGRWRRAGHVWAQAMSLAGIIAGLLARGTKPAAAAIWGVFLRGEAGSKLAKSVAPLGFLAREIPAFIPQLMIDASLKK